MDSAVCAAIATRDYDTYALHFSYGQRTEAREQQAAEAVAATTGIRQLLPLKLDLFRAIGGSALTDTSIAVPAAQPNPAATGAEIPVTYVPFATRISSLPLSVGQKSWVRNEFSSAPSNRIALAIPLSSTYYSAFNRLIATGTRDSDIEIVTPLIHLKKHDIVRRGVELGAPFHVTWSCYQGQQQACGVCESCVLRLRAFAEAGVADPIPYAQR